MYFTNDLYPPSSNLSIHSESYFNPKERVNITENKLANGGVNVYNNNNHNNNSTSVSVPHTPVGTIRRNRLKLSRMPQFRISFGDGGGGDKHNHGVTRPHQTEQLYVKVGETKPPSQQQPSPLNLQQKQQQSSTLSSSDVYVNWAQEHDQHSLQLSQHHHQQQQQQQYSLVSQPTNQRYYQQQQNHRQDMDDKDMIYVPSGNRSVISCLSANNRFDDV